MFHMLSRASLFAHTNEMHVVGGNCEVGSGVSTFLNTGWQ